MINNTEQPISREEWRRIHSVNQSQKKAAEARTKLLQLKDKLETATREIEECIRVEYTGWMALMKKHPTEGWVCLAVVNQDGPPEDQDEPEWDLCLPIPDPSTIPEFSGW